MTGKRGTTLIEALIAVAVVSIAVVTLLEALNVGLSGTLDLNRKVSALNLAKSQLEWVKSQKYNDSAGNLASVYGLITVSSGNISDKTNYNISGQVSNVSASPLLQQITVNVSYLNGKKVQLIGFKTAESGAFSPPSKGQLVTDVLNDMPYLQAGGWALGPLFGENNSGGLYSGYYHIFQTNQSGNISATWTFDWVNELYPPDGPQWNSGYSWGNPYIGIYNGTPAWVHNDSQGNVEPDGIIYRNGSQNWGDGGCMPGCNCLTTVPGDTAPIAMNPATCGMDTCTLNGNYEHVDHDCGWLHWYWWGEAVRSGTYEMNLTTTTPVDMGTYTVLFFNAEDRLSYQTVSASVTYLH